MRMLRSRWQSRVVSKSWVECDWLHYYRSVPRGQSPHRLAGGIIVPRTYLLLHGLQGKGSVQGLIRDSGPSFGRDRSKANIPRTHRSRWSDVIDPERSLRSRLVRFKRKQASKGSCLGRYVTGLGLHGIIHTAIGRCNQLCDLYEPVTHSLWQPLQLLSVLL